MRITTSPVRRMVVAGSTTRPKPKGPGAASASRTQDPPPLRRRSPVQARARSSSARTIGLSSFERQTSRVATLGPPTNGTAITPGCASPSGTHPATVAIARPDTTSASPSSAFATFPPQSFGGPPRAASNVQKARQSGCRSGGGERLVEDVRHAHLGVSRKRVTDRHRHEHRAYVQREGAQPFGDRRRGEQADIGPVEQRARERREPDRRPLQPRRRLLQAQDMKQRTEAADRKAALERDAQRITEMFVWHRELQGHGHSRPAASNLPQDRSGVRPLGLGTADRARPRRADARRKPRSAGRLGAGRAEASWWCGTRQSLSHTARAPHGTNPQLPAATRMRSSARRLPGGGDSHGACRQRSLWTPDRSAAPPRRMAPAA